jgi:hypothetical protein
MDLALMISPTYVPQQMIVVPEIQGKSLPGVFTVPTKRMCVHVVISFSTRNFNSAKDPADVRNRNLIQFCPVFFGSNPKQPPQSLTEAVAKLQTQTAFEVVPAMAIVHEAQHSIPIVGCELCFPSLTCITNRPPLATARVRDLKVTDPKDGKTKKAYSLRL